MNTAAPIKKIIQTRTAGFQHTRGDIGIHQKVFHTHSEIFLLLNGNVEYIDENSRTIIQPRTLVVIPHGVYHQFVVHGDVSEYERCVLDINPAYASADHFRNLLGEQALFILPTESGILDAFGRLRKYVEEPFAEDFHILLEAVATEILSLIRHERLSSPVVKTAQDPLSVKAMEYIHAHLDQPLSLRELADACFVSPSTLSHTFRKSYGISVMQYAQNKKLTMAKLYIRKGHSPGEAARMCGYLDYSTFYRAYLREYDSAPTKDALEKEQR